MIYYTLVGVRADRTRTGGVTPARALLPKAPRTALRGRFADFQQPVRMADGADTTPDEHTAA